jgi:hypothetical protein
MDLIIQLVLGAVGGNLGGALLKKQSLALPASWAADSAARSFRLSWEAPVRQVLRVQRLRAATWSATSRAAASAASS